MRTNTVARAAAILLAVEGAALLVLVAWQIVAMTAGDTVSIESGLALTILTAVAAAALIGFAVAVWRGRSWGRSGGIVAQVMILAVALGAATGAYAHPLTALILAIPAFVALVLLGIAVRDAGRHGRDSASG
jgi:hypothetical protein